MIDKQQKNDAITSSINMIERLMDLLTAMKEHLVSDEPIMKIQVQLTAYCLHAYMRDRLEKDVTKLIIKQAKDLHKEKSTKTRKL